MESEKKEKLTVDNESKESSVCKSLVPKFNKYYFL